jgi:glycerol-3-phosphate dehydrogenase (NAD(P)+)
MRESSGNVNESVLVIGAGSWGTALAIQLSRGDRASLLWAREPQQQAALARDRRNARYLPDATFPPGLEIVTGRLEAAVGRARVVLLAVPSHSFRATLELIRGDLRADARVAWATKGFELTTGRLPHEVAEAVLGPALPVAVVSGPTFAKEVGAGLPTAMTIASADPQFAHELAKRITGEHFRAYTSADVVGVEVGGAVKNVLAIGAGMSDGLGFGANTRIALITRGLVEMTRLGVALGAQKDTFMGLAGMGDLVLTCTDNQSRNRRFGLALAQGASLSEAQAQIGQVVEGVFAAKAVRIVAANAGVDMPICASIHRVIHDGLEPLAAVKELMSRGIKPEAI